jgi:Cof subfamily protein (haloacid dehalogenase superfamily)
MQLKKDIKLVITDLDGTLFNDQGLITEENIEAIHRLYDRGVGFGIASGRSPEVIKKIAIEYGIYDQLSLIIGYNGASIELKDDSHPIKPPYLTKEIIRTLVKTYEHEDVAFIVHEGNQLIVNKVNTYVDYEKDFNGYGLTLESDFIDYISRDYPKLMIVGEQEILDEVDQTLISHRSIGFHSFRSHEHFLEVVANGVSKGDTLALYCDYVGMSYDEVMTFGDQLNDFEMIDFAGCGIAMANAVQDLKDVADFITTRNSENGFAYGIGQMLTIKSLFK